MQCQFPPLHGEPLPIGPALPLLSFIPSPFFSSKPTDHVALWQMSAARAVYSESGMSGFLRGIGPRAVSNGINSAVFFCFFEALRKVFANQV